MHPPYAYDYLIIGSGFGGSVSALRLSEKGYKVAVIEQGREFKSQDFAKTDWNLRRFLWMPSLGLHGILKCSFLNKVFVLSGCGVGGGSLVYANTLMRPPDNFFESPGWPEGKDWKTALQPFYEKASCMMGANTHPFEGLPEDEILKEIAGEKNRTHTFKLVKTGVYFGDPDIATDPYFNGEGPLRNGCTGCAGCMTGCRNNAKNTLDKNYLWFAQKNGTAIFPDTKALKIRQTKHGYEVKTRKLRNSGLSATFSCKNLIISAGVLGTTELLLKQKFLYYTLPGLPDSIGMNVRTNSQSISGLAGADRKLNNGLAITSIISPAEGMHIEMVKFNDKSGFITHLGGFAHDSSHPVKRAFGAIAATLLHPVKFMKLLFDFRWGEHSIVMLVMQCCDSSMHLKLRRKWFGYGLNFDKNSGNVPAYIPEGQKILHRFARKVNGTAMNNLTETLLNKSTTAHIIGGCPPGQNPQNSVVNDKFIIHGFPGLYVLDSSVLPCNPGVNPSLSILAIAEYAMSLIPNKDS